MASRKQIMMEILQALQASDMLKVPGSAVALTSKALGGEQKIDEIGARGAEARATLDAQGRKEIDLINARAAAKLEGNRLLGELLEQVKPVAAMATAVTPDLLPTLERIRALPGGEIAAKGVEAQIEANLERATQAKVDEIRTLLGPDAALLDEANVTSRTKAALQRGGSVDAIVEAERKRITDTKAGTAEQASVQSMLQKAGLAQPAKLYKLSPEEQVSAIMKMPAGERSGAIEKAGKEAGRARTVKNAVVGGLGTAALAYLASKVFGKKQDGVPPEVQMALMAQMQRSGAGAGGASGDPSLTLGRDLLNVNRALAIVKAIGDMARLNAAPVQASQLV